MDRHLGGLKKRSGMKRVLAAFFLLGSSVAYSDEGGYEYTYLELAANYSEDVGYNGALSANVPSLPFYIKASITEEDVKSQGVQYKKSTEALSFGVHASITNILNGISKSGLSFSFDTFLDVYAEVGVNRWELEDPATTTEEGNDAYLRAGIKMGDPTAWEYDLYVEKTKLAEPVIDPATNTSKYFLSSETNNNIGIRVTTHLGKNLATSFGYNNDDFSGSTLSLGARLSF